MNRILDFLIETEPLMDNLHELSYTNATELYQGLEKCVKALPTKLTPHEAELRVEACIRLDAVLEQIVDTMPLNKSWKGGDVYTPSVDRWRHWQNVELLKDKGLVGYMLAAELQSVATMYFLSGTENEYPNLQNVRGLNVLWGDTKNERRFLDHLLDNYRKMDVLILHGCYEATIKFLLTYRRLRPDGKVFLGLDMNRITFAEIGKDWGSEQAHRVLSACDVIATSCTPMRDEINLYSHFPAPCRLLTNAFFGGGG
ncbi:MAG: hypothetical protein FWG65_12475, partial [Turicibacter sp.]|nr:hypothetical protein [Turicibacter sp.]